MAHFARIENGTVIEVIVVGDEYEETYSDSRKEFGEVWIQTSYNARIRFNFAGIGYSYDPIDDAFIPPMWECGHEELTLNENKHWECANSEHIPLVGEN